MIVLILFVGVHADLSLICGNKKFHCPNEKVTHTCKAPDIFLEWNIQNSPQNELGFAGRVDLVGTTRCTTYHGVLFIAELTSKSNGSIVSSINYTIERSLNNTSIFCENGNIIGDSRKCMVRLLRT